MLPNPLDLVLSCPSLLLPHQFKLVVLKLGYTLAPSGELWKLPMLRPHLRPMTSQALGLEHRGLESLLQAGTELTIGEERMELLRPISS